MSLRKDTAFRRWQRAVIAMPPEPMYGGDGCAAILCIRRQELVIVGGLVDRSILIVDDGRVVHVRHMIDIRGIPSRTITKPTV